MIKNAFFKGKNLEDYESVKIWFNGLKSSSAGTRHTYLVNLRDFCKWLDKTPDEIIADRRRRYKKDPLDRYYENKLDAWYDDTLKAGKSKSYATARFTAAVSFFRYNGLKLNVVKFPTVMPSEQGGVKRLRREEILKMYNMTGRLREKLILLVGAESGLRVKALKVLTVGYIKDLKTGHVPAHIELPQRFYFGKKSEGIAFLCQDAMDLLREYLDLRRSWGEPITDKSPIFPSYRATLKFESGRVINSHLKRYYPVGTKLDRVVNDFAKNGERVNITETATVEKITVQHLSVHGFERTMRKLRDRAKIEFNEDRERAPSVHSLRKYLHSALDVAGVSANLVDVIIGHSRKVRDAYSGRVHLDIEEIRHAYESAMHRIMILRPAIEKEKLNALEQQLEKKSNEIEILLENGQRKTTQIGELSDRLERLEYWIKTQEDVYSNTFLRKYLTAPTTAEAKKMIDDAMKEIMGKAVDDLIKRMEAEGRIIKRTKKKR